MSTESQGVLFIALFLISVDCCARPTPIELLRQSGHLTLSQPSPDQCGAVVNQNDLMPCSDDGYVDTLSIDLRSEGIYGVHMERREASVAYDSESGRGYVSPNYCSFGGRGKLSGSQILITDDEDEDGEPIVGFVLTLEKDSVTVTETGVQAQKYCGAHAGWNGLKFSLQTHRH